MTTVLHELAQFAADFSLSDTSENVRESARRSLIDTLGCMLGGSTVGPVRTLASTVHDPKQIAPVFGTPYRAHPYHAAFIGGVAGTWMDADSGGTKHPAGGRVPPVPTAHPAVHLLPALLAETGAIHPVPGDELIRIYLVSHEVGQRIGSATRLLPGIHPHGVHGTSSAALAIGLARKLEVGSLARSMELATSLPLVTSLHVAMSGATVRNAYAGLGARNGMMAVDAAMRGAAAPADALQAVLAHGLSDALDTERLLRGLGRDWESARAYVKPHACARWIHPALDAVGSLMPAETLDPDSVQAIEIRTFRFAAMMNDPHPPTDLGAKFSVPYCVAAMVCFGSVELDAFKPAAMRRRDLQQLSARVEVVEEPDYTAALPERRPTTVMIRYRDGRTATASVEGAHGDPEDPLTAADLEGKYLRLATAALGSKAANRSLDLLRHLPELPGTDLLVEALLP